MAVYNGEKYIREQMDSILNQTEQDWQLIVSDDESTDHTPNIVKEYVRNHPDRISFIAQPHRFGNPKDHFMALLKQTDADYYFFSDQDDVWAPEKVETLMDRMYKGEDEHGKDFPLLVFSDLMPVNEDKETIAPSLMRYQKQYFLDFDWRSILLSNVVTGGSMLANRSLVQKALCCSDQKYILMHDWWLALVAAKFGRIIYIDQSLGLYRQHNNNAVGAKDVSSAFYFSDKVAHLKEVSLSLQNKKKQANVFHETFRDQLTEDDELFLNSFVKKRSGPAFYWKNRKLIHSFSRLAGMMILG